MKIKNYRRAVKWDLPHVNKLDPQGTARTQLNATSLPRNTEKKRNRKGLRINFRLFTLSANLPGIYKL